MPYTPRTHQWLGIHQTGDVLTFWLTTRNAAGTPTIPDACPTFQIVKADGTSVVTATKMIIRDRYALDTSGANNCVFEGSYLLDANFTVTSYYVIFSWLVSSALFREVDVFNLGGTADGTGQVLSLDRLPQPENELVVHHVRGGDILYGRNPF